MMNNSALLIEWDENNKKEIEEAKLQYQKARSLGRVVTDVDGNIIQFFNPNLCGIKIQETELSEHQFSMRILDETGDRRLIWDAMDTQQLDEAEKLFQVYKDRGWRAYAVDVTGKKKRKIYTFDAKQQEVFFEERSISNILTDFGSKITNDVKKPKKIMKEALADFVKAFNKIEVLPRTYPG